ncbi:MAG: Gfo/Idh/MocA family oxidoreductase [Pirellulaceae bacterium]|nr:Gfo/Idh/MocA family oxidoreductase [Pirellulaceae bacterium]
MSKQLGISRRAVLAGSAAAAFGSFVVLPRRVWGANERLNVASVGVGGMGSNDIRQVGATENVVALCDVDANNLARSAERFPAAKTHRDFRTMFDVQKDIDAVMVGTPDHAHAVVTMMALKLGKHVFCQKPLTRTVHEAIEIGRAAKAAGVATQMGNQGQASEGARLVCEFIWDGAIGPVREIHSWSNRRPDISPRGIPRPKDTPPVPSHLDWDLWLGPAPVRPYHPCYHPFAWRGWWDFGTGVLGDIGCHNVSAAFKALKLKWPVSVEACSTHWNAPPEVRNETAPAASIVTFRFAAEGERPEIVLRWYDGGMMPPQPLGLDVGRNIFENDGTLIVGDQGMLLGHRLLPETRNQEYGRPPQVLPRSPGHYQEWIDACKGGPPAGSNFPDHAAHLAAVVMMGNIAIRTQEKLLWDAEQLKFSNSDVANQLLDPPYREGWSL